MRIGNPLPVGLSQESRKAVKTLRSFVSPTDGLDGLIPSSVLRAAHGFAIFTVVKAGFLMSVRAGTGLVIARLPNGRWSAPSAIGTGGMGFGGQAGAEVTEFVLVLNSRSAVRQFMSAGSITLGGNVSVALGPVGRNIEGAGALNTRGKVAAMYSYSKTKGAFAGMSIEGSAIFERQDCNLKSYGSRVTATHLLSGQVEPPEFAAELIELLNSRAGIGSGYMPPTPPSSNRNSMSESSPSNPFEKSGERPSETLSPQSPSDPSNQSRSASNHSPVKRPTPKKSFSLTSWRSNSKKDRKYASDFHDIRTDSPSHWIEATGHSSQEDRWMAHGGLNREIVQSSAYDLTNPMLDRVEKSKSASVQDLDLLKFGQIRQDTTLISERRHLDHYSSSGRSRDFDELTLSSMGSDIAGDQVESLAQDTNQERLDGPPRSRSASCGTQGSNWFLSRAKSPSKTNVPGGGAPAGIVDDLISFDQIGSSSPVHRLQSISPNRSMTHEGSSLSNQFETEPPNQRIPNKLSKSFNQPRNQKSREEELRGRSDNYLEEDADFLIGTGMPSVMRTKTDLTGFLGKVVGLYDFEGSEPGDLSFRKGDCISVIEKVDDQWWKGSIGLRKGIFPVNRVQVELNS